MMCTAAHYVVHLFPGIRLIPKNPTEHFPLRYGCFYLDDKSLFPTPRIFCHTLAKNGRDPLRCYKPNGFGASVTRYTGSGCAMGTGCNTHNRHRVWLTSGFCEAPIKIILLQALHTATSTKN